MSLGMGNVGWYLMMCIIIPVRYLAPRSFAIVSTKREEYVKRKTNGKTYFRTR
jgi:hypothetical protein